MSKYGSKPKILTVDDKPANLYVLEKLLARLEVEIFQAHSGFEALSLTLEHEFSLAIVDVQMPEMDGYELVELLRGNPGTSGLPVIFVSAIYSDEYHHRKGYSAGAVDFLSKPFAEEILLSKVRVFLDLYHQRVKLEALVNQLNAKNEALEDEIIQRKHAEAALQEANNHKDRLFSIISHDLRDPFQVMLGNAKWMVERIKSLSRTDIQEMAASIHKSAEATFNLLENLLTWSRLQRNRLEFNPAPVDLHQLADNTVSLLAEMASGKKIRLVNQIDERLIVQADEYMVDTILRNLSGNALKFTPPEGQVTLAARQNGHSADNPEAAWVEVTVADTGVGINQADIDKLFKLEAHYTTTGTAREKGTGLGLLLCHEMVTRHGGQIWIDSEEDKGTTVTFTLPGKHHPHPEKP
jgi:signal transduction histidine kinase